MKRIVVLTIFMIAGYALSQQSVISVSKTEVEVRSSPASDALVQLAKDALNDSKTLNDKFQQARSALDKSQKSLNDELTKFQTDLNAKLQDDKKYRPTLDQIADLKKKITDVQNAAQASYQSEFGPLQQRVLTENAQIEGIVKVVKKENNLPDNAAFDTQTQKWSIPAPEKVSEKK